MYNQPMRQVIIHPGEDGLWVAEVPSLPGCISQGRTFLEAVENVKDAIDVWISVMREKGRPVPPESFETQVVCVA